MKKIFLLIILIIPLGLSAESILQKYGLNKKSNLLKESQFKKFDPDNLAYGGNFWAQFGTYTYAEISPMVGYRVTDKLMPGLGIGYTYMQQRFSQQLVYKSHLFAVRSFLRFDLLDQVFLYGEYEMLNWDYYDFLSNTSGRKWSGTPFVGGGYIQGDNGGFAFMIYALYAINWENPESPYYNRPLVLRVGFMFG